MAGLVGLVFVVSVLAESSTELQATNGDVIRSASSRSFCGDPLEIFSPFFVTIISGIDNPEACLFISGLIV